MQLDLSTAMRGDDLAGGAGSVEIRFGGGERGEKLSVVTLFPVAAPAVAARIARVEDLAQEILLQNSSAGDDWDLWLESQGKGGLAGASRHSFDSYLLTLDLARRGLGIAMAHQVLVGDLLLSGELVRIFSHEIEARAGYYLFGARDGGTAPAAQAFCDWLKQQFVG